MTRRRCLALLLAALAGFPGAARAASSLRRPTGKLVADYDGKSFKIGDRRFLLLAGGVHYFRIPPSEWRHRLAQTRLAGFNTVETPVPWSLHQPRKDAFETAGFADLGRFLDLCHERGLMALVRVGPYVNAALSNGGLPAWLGDQPKLRVRAADPLFLEAVRAYWRRLLPIIVRRQVPAGPVVLVQAEDHYRAAARGYLSKLYDELVAGGCRVPIVLSELHPCKGFQQIAVPDDSVYATTELMPTPPLAWGESNRSLHHLDDIVLEGIARGIDGYNLPLWAAGTNLATLQASSFATRFESNSCGIRQSGALSGLHTELKHVNLFAATFTDVLAASSAADTHWLVAAARRDGLVAYARSDGSASIVFLKRRYGARPFTFTNPATASPVTITVGDGLLRHLVFNYPLTPKTSLAMSGAQILAIHKLRDRTRILAHAQPDATAFMAFATPARPKLIRGGNDMAWDAAHKQLLVQWKQARTLGVTDYLFQADRPVHLVVVPEDKLDQAWALDGTGFLLGAPGVNHWTREGVELLLPARRTRLPMTFYPDGSQSAVAQAPAVHDAKHDPATGRIDFTVEVDAPRPTTILLRHWKMAELADEIAPGFNDSAWAGSPRPRPLGELPYGWYRAPIKSDRDRTRTLLLKDAADAVTIFLNGRYLGQSTSKRLLDAPRSYARPLSFQAPIRKGENTLAVLVKNWGRYRLTEIDSKPLAEATAWGLLDDVTLDGALVSNWRRRDGIRPPGPSARWVEPAKAGCPVRWYTTTFKLRQSPARPVTRAVLKGLRHGALWINGRFAGLYLLRGFDAGNGCYLPPAWLKPVNTLTVLEEDGGQPTEPEVRFDRHASLVPLRVTFR